MKLKITSGSLKGRFIAAPKGDQTRPTSEKVRQSFFNSYRSLVEDSSFLDLFAGSGAMGFEAFSVGAKEVVLVESHKLALQSIHQNKQILEIEEGIHVIGKDVMPALEELEKKKSSFSLVYIDPPYAQQQIKEKVLHYLDVSSLLKAEAFVFLEENTHHQTNLSSLSLKTLHFSKTKEIGDTLIHVFSYRPS